MPWSPLARGRLTRDWDATSARTETDEFGRTLYAQAADADRQVVEAVAAVATRLGAAARAGGAGLGAAAARRHRADRRRHEAGRSSTTRSRRWR